MAKLKKFCKFCNKEFLVRPYRNSTAKFCSRQCHDLWRNKKIKNNCDICNKEFYSKLSSYNKKYKRDGITKYAHKRFCSRKCYGVWMSKHENGEKNRGWKGENCITPERQRIRQSYTYKKWQQTILTRDKFKCQECGASGGILNAHHKKPFSILLKEAQEYLPLMDIYEAVMTYTPIWDIDNGITLCEKCHEKKHCKDGMD